MNHCIPFSIPQIQHVHSDDDDILFDVDVTVFEQWESYKKLAGVVIENFWLVSSIELNI